MEILQKSYSKKPKFSKHDLQHLIVAAKVAVAMRAFHFCIYGAAMESYVHTKEALDSRRGRDHLRAANKASQKSAWRSRKTANKACVDIYLTEKPGAAAGAGGSTQGEYGALDTRGPAPARCIGEEPGGGTHARGVLRAG